MMHVEKIDLGKMIEAYTEESVKPEVISAFEAMKAPSSVDLRSPDKGKVLDAYKKAATWYFGLTPGPG